MKPCFFGLPLALVLVVTSLFLHAQVIPEKSRPKANNPLVSPLAQAEVDSLQLLLRLTPLTGKIAIYGQLCFTYASTIGNLERAHQYADSIQLVATQLKSKAALSTATFYAGMLARLDGQPAEALRHFNQHLAFCKTTKDSAGVANSLIHIAVVNNELGNYDKSLAISYQAMNLYEKIGDWYGVARSAMNIGMLFVSMKKGEDAIEMFQKSLASFTRASPNVNAKMGKLRALINLGDAYAKMKQYEKARRFFKQSLALSQSIGSPRTAATSLGNIGEVLTATNQYDSALVYHLRALAMREQALQRDKMAINLTWIGETYLALKKYPQAQAALLRALALAQEYHSKPTQRDVYEKLSVLSAAQQDFKKAYHYHQLFALTQDSILNEESARRLSELQTKYETGEKDKQIALLAKEKQVQQKEAQRQKLQQRALVGGLLLVLVIAWLFIYLLRQRLKNQKIVLLKNQEIQESNLKRQMTELEMKALRAQMNPHFIFNCMNSINRMILDGETDGASRYLVKLSKLIRLILENTEKSFVSLANELTMLDAYLQLENLRFKGRIGYAFRVDEAIDPEITFIPPMVLQPFVENAIWHGLMHKEKTEEGTICISIAEKEDTLICVIEDNGVGREMATKLERKPVGRKSLGLQITEERLRLFHKGKMGRFVQITDLKDAGNQATGTRVDIQVPLG
ncbi:tetratricopeptide repeat-containing sensor histidine kinase [Adhaeribacter pallidiroseus]|uniref:Tetratricopeptide repeat protein n=1 Tax=Adhaeribacter pallidiroseus TaxID=2072847 RepID=A0A369QTS4_9BACT|nr:tetratricopeptide repeat protein [Adhaeribacter pallidiroseus]RDC65558.1 Tetratricopeptide repeat protein [Adhaeribacter pallidiroseus]